MRLSDIADVLDEQVAVISGLVAHLWRLGEVSITGADDLALIEVVR